MKTYKDLYFFLFNAMTDAISDLENEQVITAIHRMKLAQQFTEEAHLAVDILAEEEA